MSSMISQSPSDRKTIPCSQRSPNKSPRLNPGNDIFIEGCSFVFKMQTPASNCWASVGQYFVQRHDRSAGHYDINFFGGDMDPE